MNNVPVYAPCFETLRCAFLGTFELVENAFYNRCGIAIGPKGRIYTQVQLSDDAVPRVKTPKDHAYPEARDLPRSGSFANPSCSTHRCEVSCQTDEVPSAPVQSSSEPEVVRLSGHQSTEVADCLLYTSDAADE